MTLSRLAILRVQAAAWRGLLGLTLLVMAVVPARSQSPTYAPFEFVALGDVPYKTPQDFPKFDRLIEAINAVQPAFSLHVGDIKSSSEPCTDEYFKNMHGRFQRFEQPLIYTPGDNEWTDCGRERAGRYNPRERLDKIREIFYPVPGMSLGKAPMAVESQAKLMPAYVKYVENQRFWKNGVLFVAAHVVGSNNGFETSELEAASEYFERNKANIAWLDDSFKYGRDQGAKAMVVFVHATFFDIKQKFPALPAASGFVDTLKAIDRGARLLAKPLLLVHGDEHDFEVEGLKGVDYKRIPNAWRMQVMGADYVHAVRVTVDPSSPSVFGFRALVVPENGAY
jgi:hypothetical protein